MGHLGDGTLADFKFAFVKIDSCTLAQNIAHFRPFNPKDNPAMALIGTGREPFQLLAHFFKGLVQYIILLCPSPLNSGTTKRLERIGERFGLALARNHGDDSGGVDHRKCNTWLTMIGAKAALNGNIGKRRNAGE